MTLKERRHILNLTMKQVADAAEISESMYCLVENGRRTPSLKVIKKIAVTLNCTIDELLTEKETSTKESEEQEGKGCRLNI